MVSPLDFPRYKLLVTVTADMLECSLRHLKIGAKNDAKTHVDTVTILQTTMQIPQVPSRPPTPQRRYDVGSTVKYFSRTPE